MVHTWSRYVPKNEATNPLYSTVWQHRNLHGRIFTVQQRTDIYCERGQVAIRPDEQWVTALTPLLYIGQMFLGIHHRNSVRAAGLYLLNRCTDKMAIQTKSLYKLLGGAYNLIAEEAVELGGPTSSKPGDRWRFTRTSSGWQYPANRSLILCHPLPHPVNRRHIRGQVAIHPDEQWVAIADGPRQSKWLQRSTERWSHFSCRGSERSVELQGLVPGRPRGLEMKDLRGQVAIHPDEQWVAIADGGNHVAHEKPPPSPGPP